MRNATKESIILLQRLIMHQANRILVILMKSFLQMQLQDTKEVRDTMYFSRQELTSMVRKLN